VLRLRARRVPDATSRFSSRGSGRPRRAWGSRAAPGRERRDTEPRAASPARDLPAHTTRFSIGAARLVVNARPSRPPPPRSPSFSGLPLGRTQSARVARREAPAGCASRSRSRLYKRFLSPLCRGPAVSSRPARSHARKRSRRYGLGRGARWPPATVPLPPVPSAGWTRCLRGRPPWKDAFHRRQVSARAVLAWEWLVPKPRSRLAAATRLRPCRPPGLGTPRPAAASSLGCPSVVKPRRRAASRVVRISNDSSRRPSQPRRMLTSDSAKYRTRKESLSISCARCRPICLGLGLDFGKRRAGRGLERPLRRQRPSAKVLRLGMPTGVRRDSDRRRGTCST
jgi:hypothetical protein